MTEQDDPELPSVGRQVLALIVAIVVVLLAVWFVIMVVLYP